MPHRAEVGRGAALSSRGVSLGAGLRDGVDIRSVRLRGTIPSLAPYRRWRRRHRWARSMGGRCARYAVGRCFARAPLPGDRPFASSRADRRAARASASFWPSGCGKTKSRRYSARAEQVLLQSVRRSMRRWPASRTASRSLRSQHPTTSAASHARRARPVTRVPSPRRTGGRPRRAVARCDLAARDLDSWGLVVLLPCQGGGADRFHAVLAPGFHAGLPDLSGTSPFEAQGR
jgi:hypothetical protein